METDMDVATRELPSGITARRRALRGALALSLCAAFSSSAAAQDHFSLLPDRADPGKPFGAMLASSRYHCGYTFVGDTARTYGKEIDLAFVAKEDPAVKCAPSVAANGPHFTVPALAAGVYAVYAEPMPACAVSPTPCPFALIRIFVDSLRVTPGGDSTEARWFIRPREAKAQPLIDLLLASRAYASCENIFTGVTWELRNHGIHMDYQVAYLKRLCEYSVRPYGMVLPLDTLKPGSYPVYVSQNHCNPYLPACAAPSEALVDTLKVASAAEAIAAEPRMAGLEAASLPGGISLRAPWDLDGAARLELFDCDGRRAALFSGIRSPAGAALHLPRPRGLTAGLYFLRLSAPGHAPVRRTLAVP
jgi:hypothetical protein